MKLTRSAVMALALEALGELECTEEEYAELAEPLIKLARMINNQDKKDEHATFLDEEIQAKAKRIIKKREVKVNEIRKRISSAQDIEQLILLKGEIVSARLLEKMNDVQYTSAIERSIEAEVIRKLGFENNKTKDGNFSVALNHGYSSMLESLVKSKVEETVKKMQEVITQNLKSNEVESVLQSSLDYKALTASYTTAMLKALRSKIENTWNSPIEKDVERRLLEIKRMTETKDPTVAIELLSYIYSLQATAENNK
jgi:hypothetical protein